MELGLRPYNKCTVIVTSQAVHSMLCLYWPSPCVRVQFPIEVGTWGGNIRIGRGEYGRGLRGVGGMNKTVFARNYKAIDEGIERLKSLVELGVYIPCPDHRIAPDAE